MTTATTQEQTPTAALTQLVGAALTAIGSIVLDAVIAPFNPSYAIEGRHSETTKLASSEMLPASSKTEKKPWVVSQGRVLRPGA